MGCMPYGPRPDPAGNGQVGVSIPHMGCMPYGPLAGAPLPTGRRVSIPHMGCMPYGLFKLKLVRTVQVLFQSLIWVACPTGAATPKNEWLGCKCFNPSYGLHALRAWQRSGRWLCLVLFQSLIWVACPTGSRNNMMSIRNSRSFNPSYGLHALRAPRASRPTSKHGRFQSLIWVACPTGHHRLLAYHSKVFVSIPHMGCMPYGLLLSGSLGSDQRRFNPSYGLHALRARLPDRCHQMGQVRVSIPHMGCMPYGPYNLG